MCGSEPYVQGSGSGTIGAAVMEEGMDKDFERALQDTSDALQAALEELIVLEERKGDLSPGDPELVELSARIEDIAEQVFGATAAQRELAERAEAQGQNRPVVRPRAASVILREWRDLERRAAAATPGSDE